MELQAAYGGFNADLVYANNRAGIEQTLANSGFELFAMYSMVDRLGIFGGYPVDLFNDWHQDLNGRCDQYDFSNISIADAGLFSREADARVSTLSIPSSFCRGKRCGG
jgi:hypothetical protein